jgi:hypothetical protein
MSGWKPEVWDDEDQNALLDEASEFCMGDTIVLQHTNPGVQGRIVGIYDPRVYYTGMTPQHAEMRLEQWSAYLSILPMEVAVQRLYVIMFSKPIDNGVMSKNLPEAVRKVQQIRIAVSPEGDIMNANQYWEEFAQQLESKDDGEAETTPEGQG